MADAKATGSQQFDLVRLHIGAVGVQGVAEDMPGARRAEGLFRFGRLRA